MSQTLTLTSPPDRDSLFNSVLEVGFWTAAWFGVSLVTRITVGVPSGIAKEGDEKKKQARISEYVNYLVSMYHAILLVLVTTYAFFRYPFTRNRPFTDLEMFLMKVGSESLFSVLSDTSSVTH